MIRRLVVSNYRSLGPNLELRPGPLSIFIGPNGSGKSNYFDTLSFVRDAVMQGLPAAITHRGGIDAVRRRSSGRPFDIHIELELMIGSYPCRYGFTITGDRLEEYRVKSEIAKIKDEEGVCDFHREGDDWLGPEGLTPRMDEQSLALTALGGSKRFKPLVDFLSQITVYSIFPDTLRVPQKFDPVRPMARHGENWMTILRDLTKSNLKDDLVAGLKKLTGDIEDVRVRSGSGHLFAEFKQSAKAKKGKGKRWFEASQQSDGTLRVAGLLTALLQEPHLPVIAIEEPELTVHPGVLPMLYEYLQQASEVSQILITTHSPIILDLLMLERDSVFVVNRVDGKTQIKVVTENQLKPVRESLLRLGDLFLSGDLQLSLFDDLSQ
ncbi:MAG: AAA family ATPase [Myxococcota bacterium]|nr:AAA family ATPase [Myxococcota bacterium]